MMVSVDTRLLSYHRWSGVEYYTYNIIDQLSALGGETELCLHFDVAFSDPRVDALLIKPNVSRQVRAGSARFYAALPFDLLRRKSSVYYAMGGRLQYYRPPCPSALTIHDCAPFLRPDVFPGEEAKDSHGSWLNPPVRQT